MLKSNRVSWRLLDDEEYDEIMSRKLWQEVCDQDEFLDIDFNS
jgi:predicted house-cleaning noncanonical NTP pyrophosphatase (MazG superfamily)